MSNKRNLILALAVLCLALFAGSVMADSKIVEVTHTGAMNLGGQSMPAKDDTTVTWIGDGYLRMNHGDTSSVIVDVEKGLIYYISHTAKTYAVLELESLGDFKKMFGIDENDPQQMASYQMIQQMLQMQKLSVKTTPVEGTEKIGDWNCNKYKQEYKMGMMSINSDIWATEEIKVDHEMYLKLANFFMAIMPGYQEALPEMEKVKGWVVKRDGMLNVMGTSVDYSSQLVDYEEADPPAGSYEVPADYSKTDGLQMPGMGGR